MLKIVHKGKSIKTRLDKKNLTEHLRDELKRLLDWYQQQTTYAFVFQLQNLTAKLQNLLQSFPRRVEVIITANVIDKASTYKAVYKAMSSNTHIFTCRDILKEAFDLAICL